MSEGLERVCVGCGDSEEEVRLEACGICSHLFCAGCAHKAGYGRRFCSSECTRAYYFAGEPDDDDSGEPEE